MVQTGNPGVNHPFFCSSILCYLQSRTAKQPGKQRTALVYRRSLAASCCLGAEREEPMPAALLGLLLFRTFCAVDAKVSDAVKTRVSSK